MKKIKPIITSLLLFYGICGNAQHELVVKVNEPKADIQPAMWGVFFEDINLAVDHNQL